jgi:hypothetical protein
MDIERTEESMGKQNRSQEVRVRDGPKADQEAAQEEIRALAYQLFCECGCEQGHDLVHWLEAERKVLEQLKEERG